MKQAPVVLAWSGGKDAAWTLHVLRAAGIKVVALLTTLTRGEQRVSMQGIRRDVLHAQARSARLPLVEAWIDPHCDNDAYEAAFSGALDACSGHWPQARTVAFGDLFLQDIRDYRAALCARNGWDVSTPLFGRDTATLASEMIDGGLVAHVCCVDTTQLDAAFAGRRFDHHLVAELPASVDPCGENGEFHTCVSGGPMFDAPLVIAEAGTSMVDGRFAYTDFAITP